MRNINSRADVEALRGTPAFAQAITALAGSMTITVNVAEYPEGYGTDEYEGPEIDPVWDEQEDLSSVERLGFTKSEILTELGKL